MDSSPLPTAYRLLPTHSPDPFNNSAPHPSHNAEDARCSADGMVDRQIFDRLMLDHLDRALRFAIRLSGDASAGEELVQESLARAAAARGQFRGEPSAFRTWLFQIVVNVFRDGLRSRRAGEMPEDVRDARTVEPPAQVAASELAEHVAKLVSALPPRQREVMLLVTYEQLSTTEAAAMLGITEQNARTNLSLARSALKRQLAPYFSNDRVQR